MKHLLIALLLVLPIFALAAGESDEVYKGKMVIELYPDKAPLTVKNFLTYVDEKFYYSTIFHRVIPGFVIQGGGLTKDMAEKKTHDPIKNEADNGLKNARYTLSMARTMDIDSATSQFFINLVDNSRLDFTGKQDSRSWGYAVFGKVVEGMEVVDVISKVPTGTVGMYQDVPKETATIMRAYRMQGSEQGNPKVVFEVEILRKAPSIRTVAIRKTDYDQIQNGMRLSDVERILQSRGEEVSNSKVGETEIKTYRWENSDHSSLTITIQDGVVVSKRQFKLK
jgi:peptidyl-prolyl cis-trans isomerase B (cyclophilin B)